MYKHIWQWQPINIYQDLPPWLHLTCTDPRSSPRSLATHLALGEFGHDWTIPPKLSRPILGNLLMKGIQIHNSDEIRVLWVSNPIPYTHCSFFEKIMIA